MPSRPIRACDRCRTHKRGCDHLRPSCNRCIKAKAYCIYNSEDAVFSEESLSPGSSSLGALPSPGRPAFEVNESMFPDRATALVAGPLANRGPASLDSPSSQVSPAYRNGRIAIHVQHHSLTALPLPDLSSIGSEYTAAKRSPSQLDDLDHGRRFPSSGAPAIDYTQAYRDQICARPVQTTVPTERSQKSGAWTGCSNAPDMAHDNSKAMMAHWEVHHLNRGANHWLEPLVQICDIAGPEKSVSVNAVLQNIATNACLSSFSLPGNFPFGTPGAAKFYSPDMVARLIHNQAKNVRLYVETYLELLDAINPILDSASFREELGHYGGAPEQMSLCWMSQFLMVLGLGSFVSSDPEPAVATEFMLAAEACLMKTPFMLRPTLNTLKALALMVVAKQICSATCWTVDSAFSLLGLLARAAHIIGLPQNKDGMKLSLKERRHRRQLWLTIRYIEAKVMICTGMPPVTRAEGLDTVEIDAAATDMDVPEDMQDILSQAFPTTTYIASIMNSSKHEMAYADVLKHSAKLRALIAHASRVCCSEVQFVTLDIFLRRCLMILHRPFAMHEKSPTLYPESYWTSLECSLAILRHYREIHDGDEESHARCAISGRANALGFFSAALTAMLSVMRREQPLNDEKMDGTVRGIGVPPRQLIVDTVQNCIALWEKDKDQTVFYRTTYPVLVAIYAMLPVA